MLLGDFQLKQKELHYELTCHVTNT